MQNNTPEDYKEAIRIKFEEEINGVNSNYFNPTSQANLRDLCWKIFNSNPNNDDLNVYNDFFKFKFDSSNEDTSTVYTDKFKKVGDFLKRKKDPAKIDTVNLAAILVDYELRPYRKFYTKRGIEEEKITNNFPTSEIIKEDTERSIENFFETKNRSSLLEKENESTRPKKNSRKNRFFEKLFNRSKPAIIVTAVIFCLIASTIYFAFIEKHCMQWSEDHYEVVDCNSGILNNPNEKLPYDKNLLNLRKLEVCDTITDFENIWYAKISSDKADFFNTHGRHPLNNKPLKPVTAYILKTYSEDCTSKK